MTPFADELRLVLTIALNGGLLWAGYRFARRCLQGGVVHAICIAWLFFFAAQYVAVALPGALGILNLWTMSAVAVLAVAGLWVASQRCRDAAETKPIQSPLITADQLVLIGCALFTIAFLIISAFESRLLPPVATDPLVYHLPTAVQWIQTGRLGIYPTWYWNPAASYSPASGSAFMAWWMLLAGNDVFVRYVQIPPLIFIFFLTVRISRLLGCGRASAGLLAMATTLSRPLFSEALIPKDDLLVTSFIVAAALMLDEKTLRGRLAPWTAGAALGLVLASKYTALFICPVFLFLVDSPFRAGWRRRDWFIAVGVMLAMALPWYVRNIVIEHNPLYPMDLSIFGLHLPGLFTVEHDQQLRSSAGIWKMLASTYHSLPTVLIVLLIAGWLASSVAAGRRLLKDPLARTCVIGSIITLAVFLIASPHHEVRYLFPLIVFWFASLALACGKAEQRGGMFRAAAVGFAGCVALASAATTYDRSLLRDVIVLIVESAAIGGIGVGLVALQSRAFHLSKKQLAAGLAALGATLMLYAYVQWHAYVEGYRDARFIVWQSGSGYPRQAALWKWADDNLPADANLAYANTFFVYPYYGFNFTRRLSYAPVRRELHRFESFPHIGDRIPGDLLVQRMTAAMNAEPDAATWMQNLREANAQYLVVMKHDSPDLSDDPVELRFAGGQPSVFIRVYRDDAGVIFRIEWK